MKYRLVTARIDNDGSFSFRTILITNLVSNAIRMADKHALYTPGVLYTVWDTDAKVPVYTTSGSPLITI